MPEKEHQEATDRFEKLLTLIERLRNPEGGCPWDIRQTKEDVGRYLLDETYEVLDAIGKDSPAALREELGDLLFMILFLARIAEEENLFGINGVLDDISAKMIRRHPHVFGDAKVKDAAEVKRNWDQIKRDVEKRGEGEPPCWRGSPGRCRRSCEPRRSPRKRRKSASTGTVPRA